jgi:hypothetical protein
VPHRVLDVWVHLSEHAGEHRLDGCLLHRASVSFDESAQIARSGTALPVYEPHRTPDAGTDSVAP